jgi:hypothetical protein
VRRDNIFDEKQKVENLTEKHFSGRYGKKKAILRKTLTQLNKLINFLKLSSMIFHLLQ